MYIVLAGTEESVTQDSPNINDDGEQRYLFFSMRKLKEDYSLKGVVGTTPFQSGQLFLSTRRLQVYVLTRLENCWQN